MMRVAVGIGIVIAVALGVMLVGACGGPGVPASLMPTDAPAPMATPMPASPGDGDADGAVREVTVGPEREACHGPFPQQCLVVDGELFYDAIEGFEHEAGYRYRLRIEQYDRFPGETEIPQDTGRYGYRLVAVLGKERG